ncbi:MAG: 4-alpha-glucanotransferase [Caldisericaceae bacterium]
MNTGNAGKNLSTLTKNEADLERKSGVLVHISSLKSAYGIGDLGPEAFKFVDLLSESKQSLWQVLPLNPTDPAYDNSPYHSISTFAGNTLFISPDILISEGLLSRDDLGEIPHFDDSKVQYENVISYKYRLYEKAFANFKAIGSTRDFNQFRTDNSWWLDDFALFVAAKHKFDNKAFVDWPDELKRKEPAAIAAAEAELASEVEFQKFLQFEFYLQWMSFKKYANEKGVLIIGDVPIYVDADSADVWSEPDNFKLDSRLIPTAVAGVPPDYFSVTGQLWGNPVYNWDNLKDKNFNWWKRRIGNSLKLFDFVRIDHFRGLVAYWEIPSGEQTAINGKWVPAPVYELLDSLNSAFPSLPVIAEDLGVITDDVRAVMKRYGLPGMKVLLFAFGGGNDNPYLPHNYEKNFVVYTGTHDNNTVRGWFDNEATPAEKNYFERYVGESFQGSVSHIKMMKLAESSVANFAVIPIQDILGLDGSYRMNTPATVGNNWRFRIPASANIQECLLELKEMTELYGRAP